MKLKDRIKSNEDPFDMEGYLLNVVFRESGGDPTKANGLYQTLKPFREQYKKLTGQTITEESLKDIEVATAVVAYMTEWNRRNFERNTGRLPTADETYYMHHFGPTGGRKLAEADEGALVKDLIAPWAMNANKYIKPTYTKQDLIGHLDRAGERSNNEARFSRRQAVLKELGYYTGNVDAREGKKTSRAERVFMDKFGMGSVEELDAFAEEYLNMGYNDRAQYTLTGLPVSDMYPNNRGMYDIAIKNVLGEYRANGSNPVTTVGRIKARQKLGINPRIEDVTSKDYSREYTSFVMEAPQEERDMIGPVNQEQRYAPMVTQEEYLDGLNLDDFTEIELVDMSKYIGPPRQDTNEMLSTPDGYVFKNNTGLEPFDEQGNWRGFNNEYYTEAYDTTGELIRGEVYQDGGKIRTKEWMKQWYSHPETRRRLERDFGQTALGEVQSNIDDLELIRANGIGEYSSALGKQYRKTMNPLAARRAESQRALGSKGVYFREDNIAITQGSPSTEVHEIAHATGLDRKYIDLVPEGQRVVDNRELVERKTDSIARQRVGTDGKISRTKGGGRLHRGELPWGISHLDRALNPDSRLAGYSRTSKSVLSDREFEDIKDKNRLKGIRVDYLNKSEEVYPRIMEIRHRNNIKPGEVIDDAKIEEIYQNDNNAIFDIYSKEQVKELLNTLATTYENTNTPIYAKKGGAIPRIKLNTKKQK